MEIKANEPIDAKGILEFQVKKDIKRLYKGFLGDVEEIKHQHVSMLQKLEKEIPVQYHPLLRAAFFFGEGEFGFRRKRILDAGNEAERAVIDQLSKFDIDFTRNKE